MNGRIEVESSPAEGSRFTLYLPFRSVDDEESTTILRPFTRHVTVFVAIESHQLQKALSERLEQWNISIRRYSDIAQGISEWKKCRSSDGIIQTCVLIIARENLPLILRMRIEEIPVFRGGIIAVSSVLHGKETVYTEERRPDLRYVTAPVRELSLYHALQDLVERAVRLKEPPPAENRKNDAGKAERKERILLVEDDQVSRFMTETILKKRGFIVRSVENGQDALTVFAQERFDLIVVDIQMPIMDGFTLVKKIREGNAIGRSSDVPVIALTARVLPRDKEEAVRAGVSRYLTKPLDTGEFFLCIDELLSQSDFTDELEGYLRDCKQAGKLVQEEALSRLRHKSSERGNRMLADDILKLLLAGRKSDRQQFFKQLRHLSEKCNDAAVKK